MRNLTRRIILLLVIVSPWIVQPVAVMAEDFNVEVKFHINTKRHSFDDIVKWLETNIEVAESLYSNAPKLDIHPIFVQEDHPKIEVKTKANGEQYSYLGFENATELEKFMDDHFDNQARTKTEGHLTVLVVDEVVKNENKNKGLCGRATFPHWVNPFNRKRGILLATCNAVAVEVDDYVEKYLFAHEIGHFFSLKHTFEPYVNLNPFSVSNCNKDFGNYIKCNSCQGQPKPTTEGELRWCEGTSNVMDYCSSLAGDEVLNACQLGRAAKERERYQTNDGKTNYQVMAGLRGEGACKADSECQDDEFCTAGILNLARDICKPKKARGVACTNKRQCASDRCSWGVCADADECRADSDCASDGQYCGDPISGKRTCKAKLADGRACTSEQQCSSKHCSKWRPQDGQVSGICYMPSSKAVGESCRIDLECKAGKCNSAKQCVCQKDADCGSGSWCDAGADLKANVCKRKLDKGEVCGKVGELGVGHRCKSGQCKAGFGVNLKCK